MTWPPQSGRRTLWELTAEHGLPAHRVLSAPGCTFALSALAGGSCLDRAALAGRSVLLRTAGQLPAVLALLELDGMARRIVLAPPEIAPSQLARVIADAEIDAIVGDEPPPHHHGMPVIPCDMRCDHAATPRPPMHDTEWVLLTSGTSGVPKLVAYRVASLIGPVDTAASAPVWSTFYDVRRYGGLTILLRALLGAGSMVLSDAAEPTSAFVVRAGLAGVTHCSGTPSHWRRALISGQAHRMAPGHVRLSGEIADQTILDRLRVAYPRARITHAFASSEAGLGFEVTDGRTGFPAGWIGAPGPVQLRVTDGTLRIRSDRIATRYLGAAPALADADGFVDTGDSVRLVGDRYHFVGRRSGVINVGGRKVHPEEVEAALHAHPAVLAARVHSRPSPIIGALVMAEVVVNGHPDEAMRTTILESCRAQLAPHKVPAVLRFAARIDVAPSGKLARNDTIHA